MQVFNEYGMLEKNAPFILFFGADVETRQSNKADYFKNFQQKSTGKISSVS